MEDLSKLIKNFAKSQFYALSEEMRDYFEMYNNLPYRKNKNDLYISHKRYPTSISTEPEKLTNPEYITRLLSLADFMKENNFTFNNSQDTMGYFHHEHGYNLKKIISNLDFLKDLILQMDELNIKELSFIFENYYHSRVKELAFEDFQRGDYLSAVRKVFIEINDVVKNKYKTKTGKELDGYNLMVEAFKIKNPDVLAFNSLSTQTEENIQDGYRWLFSGSIKAIRNPMAHTNLKLNKKEAFHYLTLASHLFYQIDKI